MNQQITIRKYREADLRSLKAITATWFDGVSIDQNIEHRFGPVAARDWRWRKTRHIDDDVAANAGGIVVACTDAETVGYITTRVDVEARIGGIPNYAVLPSFQKRGIGKRLVEVALDYLKNAGSVATKNFRLTATTTFSEISIIRFPCANRFWRYLEDLG